MKGRQSSPIFRQLDEEVNIMDAIERHKWVNDEDRNYCVNQSCNVQFSLFSRRHHCRYCGEIFCTRCTNQQAILRCPGGPNLVRVCTTCFNDITPMRKKITFQPGYIGISFEGNRLTKIESNTQAERRGLCTG